MRYRVLNGGCSVAVATGLVAASLAAGVASASVEVRGSIEGLPGGASAEVSLVSAPPLYDLLAAVLADDPSGLYTVEATVQAQDGRFTFEVDEPGARWVTVRSAGSTPRGYLLVGPETDTWPPVRRLEAGRATRLEFRAWGSAVTLTVGAPGYESASVSCASGAIAAVELEKTTASIVEGVLRRDGSPLPSAILMRGDGWLAGTTDKLGRYRAPEGAYRVLSADGAVSVVELTGGVAELAAGMPRPVAVDMRGIEPDGGELPFVLAAHWSSSGALLAREGGRPDIAAVSRRRRARRG